MQDIPVYSGSSIVMFYKNVYTKVVTVNYGKRWTTIWANALHASVQYSDIDNKLFTLFICVEGM